jgi:hypothetical protein
MRRLTALFPSEFLEEHAEEKRCVGAGSPFGRCRPDAGHLETGLDGSRRRVEAVPATCQSKFGTVAGYLGREAELAMKQYIDADGYARVEALVDRLVSAAGRSPDNATKK